jgi:hypothetical protein
MNVWLDLITRELLFFALLAALGAGPARFLPDRFDRVARWALAPVFGLCVGVCVTVTLVYAFPTHDTGWVVIVLAVASVALACWPTGRRAGWRNFPGAFRAAAERPSAARQSSAIVRDGLQVGVVVIVILVSFNYPLALRHTVGPDGGYSIADTTGYVSETNGEERDSVHQAERLHPPFADLATFYWAGYAHNDQQLDVSALESNVNVLLGLGSTDTDSPFLIAVLLVGALGAFAVVRAAIRRPSWAASLAGCLFAGPLFVEMFMDGSQAAIVGSAVLAPVVALGYEALRYRKTATLVLFALLVAGLQTVYPLFLPPVVIGGLLAIGVMVVRRLSRGWPSLDEVGLAIGQLAGVIALAAVFTPVAFERNLRYWIGLLNGSFSLSGLPAYVLPVNVMPGWVLQTREFYGLVNLSSASTGQFILAALVPALIVGVIALGAARHRTAAMMLAVASGAALLAFYSWSSRNCGYCVQRNSIPIAALAIPALGIGLATLAGIRGHVGVLASVVVGAVVLVAVGHEGVVERQREAQGSYLLEPQDRQALAALPPGAGPVELEGFGQGSAPPMELPLVYNLVDERTHGDVSEPTATDDGRGLLYLGGIQPLGPSFRPDYRYVLTRLAGIVTQRPVVVRYGPIALEKRVQSLDVTITGGVSVAAARFDPSGTAWVSNLLQFLVVGGRPGSPAWVSLLFEKTVPVTVPPQPEVVSVRELGSALRICLRAPAAPVARGVALKLQFTPQPAPLPPEHYAAPLPARGVRLVSMDASATSCAHY